MDTRFSAVKQTHRTPWAARVLRAAFPIALCFAGCASTELPHTTLTSSDPEAVALVTASQRAHGSMSWSTIRDLNVRYAGKWNSLGSRMRSGLADRRFRRESEEALDLAGGTIVQLHKGPGGRKFVLRAPGRVTVWYNGQADSREEVIRAAAVEADAGKMFLLGPLYFQRSGVILEKLGTAKVEGAECDQVLAVLRPGFGYAEEDRVVLSIDRETQRLRRVSMTLEGTKQGGGVDVTFAKWAQRSGVWWATDFDERLRGRLKLPLHHWTLMDLKANHGFAPRHPELHLANQRTRHLLVVAPLPRRLSDLRGLFRRFLELLLPAHAAGLMPAAHEEHGQGEGSHQCAARSRAALTA